jgi:hypothetical protein
MKLLPGRHIPRWLRWLTAVTLATVATFALLSYIGAGQGIDDTIGVTGFDIVAAQHQVLLWLWIFLVSEAGLIVAVFSLMRFGAAVELFPRVFARSMAAILLSAMTTVCLSVVFVALTALVFR